FPREGGIKDQLLAVGVRRDVLDGALHDDMKIIPGLAFADDHLAGHEVVLLHQCAQSGDFLVADSGEQGDGFQCGYVFHGLPRLKVRKIDRMTIGMSNLLGIDIGTSGTKTLICDEDGKVLATAMAEHPIASPKPGWSEQNPEDWWAAACRA